MDVNFKLLKIDHHGCTIYSLSNGDDLVVDIKAPYDPDKHRFHLHQKNHFKWKGQFAPEDHHEFKEIFNSIKDSTGVLLASHGKGKSNEGILFMQWVKKHHKQTNDPFFIGNINSEGLTEPQILAEADKFLGLEHTRMRKE